MSFSNKKNCDITRNDKQIGFSALILQYTDNNMGNVWSFDNLNSNFQRKKDEIILGTKDFHSRAQLEISESWTRSDKPSYLLPLSDQSSAVSVMRLFFGQIIKRSSGHDFLQQTYACCRVKKIPSTKRIYFTLTINKTQTFNFPSFYLKTYWNSFINQQIFWCCCKESKTFPHYWEEVNFSYLSYTQIL